jgi:ribosomal protein S27AE
MWNRGYIPTLSSNHQNCDRQCGGVPVLSHYEGNTAVFKCGACGSESRVVTRKR